MFEQQQGSYPGINNNSYRSRVLANTGMYVLDDIRAQTGFAHVSTTSLSQQYPGGDSSSHSVGGMMGSARLGMDNYKNPGNLPAAPQSSYAPSQQRLSGRASSSRSPYILDKETMYPPQQSQSQITASQSPLRQPHHHAHVGAGVLRQQVFQFENTVVGQGSGENSNNSFPGGGLYGSQPSGGNSVKGGGGMLNVAGSSVLVGRPVGTSNMNKSPFNGKSNSMH